MTSTYTIGDVVICEGRFFDNRSKTAVDPALVRFRLKLPSGARVTYQYGVDSQVIKTAPGVYQCRWSTTEAGRHNYRFESTGLYQAAQEGSFRVRGSAV